MEPPAETPQRPPDAYYARVNRPLLDLLPPSLGRVLDIGCASGALGRAYKERHPDTVWVGVELDERAATAARAHLDHVVQADAGTLWADTLPGAPFDALVYADSLEHVRDPAGMLARHLRALRPGGVVCASIPNVQHWSAVLDLLAGRWDYREEGLFDRTHLRFFTLDGIVALLRDAGCRMETAVPIIPRPGAPLIPDAARQEAMMEELRRTTGALGLPFDPRRFLAYQYALRARLMAGEDGGP